MNKRFLSAAVLSVMLFLLATGISADTGYNTQNDPLVTLSYLDKVKKELSSELGTKVSSEVKSQVQSQVDSQVKSKITAEVKAQIDEQVRSKIAAEVKNQLTSDYKKQLSAEIRAQVIEDLKEQITADLRPQIEEQVRREIEEKLTEIPSAETGYKVVRLSGGETLWAKTSLEAYVVMGDVACKVLDPVNVAAGIGMLDFTSGERILNEDTVTPGHYVVVISADGRGFLARGEEAYLMIRGEYSIG